MPKELKDIYLHIGRHKTGTTSIQEILSKNFESLISYGVLYPKTGRQNFLKINHHGLFKPNSGKDNFSAELSDEQLDKLIEEINLSSCQKVIISTEIFSRPARDKEQLLKLKQKLGHRVHVIVYFRKQSTFLLSSYAERIKQGLVENSESPFDINLQLDYLEFLSDFEKVFGSENINIRIFEQCMGEKLFPSFFCLISEEKIKGFSLEHKKSNKKLSWSYLNFLKSLKKGSFTRKFFSYSKTQKIVNYFFQIFGKSKAPLSSEDLSIIDKKYFESNRQLAKRYFSSDAINKW